MAVGSQYKVNQLAKDLSLKTKELTDVMAAAGLDAKTQKALETFELDVIWETLTKSHQIVGIEDYIDGVTGIPSLRKKAAETKSETKPKAEKPEVKSEAKSAKPAPKAEEKKPEAKPVEQKHIRSRQPYRCPIFRVVYLEETGLQRPRRPLHSPRL